MASDGSVTIKVQANDTALKDLLKSIKDLKSQLDNLSGTSPFEAIKRDAQGAVQSLTGVSEEVTDISESLARLRGDPIDFIAASADGADAELMGMGQTIDQVDSSLDGFEAAGIDEVGASADRSEAELEGMENAAKGASDGIDGIDDKKINETEQSTNRLTLSILDLAKSTVVVKAVSAVFDMLKNSIDGAIDRFDTLTIYPRTMEALGFSTEQVDRSMRKLDRGIQGLPTKLNDIVSNTQRIAGVTGDLDLATDTALALNNAFLASGSSAADAARGTEQYVQMLSRGEVDMQSWRTLQETMTLALVRTAEAFGYTGASAQNDLYSALQAGTVTFDEFNAKLIELSDGVDGFADLAQTNSASLRTAWTNIQTAFVRGVANVIGKLDELSKAVTGNSITENINALQGVVNAAFSTMGTAIDAVTPIVVATSDAFRWMIDTLEPISPLLKGVAAGFAALVIINQIRKYMDTLSVATLAVTKVLKYQELGIKAANLAMVNTSFITKALATAYGILTGAISAKTLALGLASKAWTVLSTTIKAMTGPIGWIIAAIGAVIGIVVALKNTLGEASPEMQQLSSEMDEAAQATSSLSDEIAQSSDSFDRAKEKLEGQAQSTRNLIEQTVALADQERHSAGDKKLLKDNIDELNDSMQGLNLVYDEEQGKLTASTEALEARVQMMEEEAKMAESQERLFEISEQRAEATAQLDENSRKLDEAQRLLDESGMNWFGRNNELKESVSELEAENATLQERINDLAEDEVAASQMREEAAQSYAEAQEEASSHAITSLESLTEAQRGAAEAMRSEYQSLVDKARDWSTAIDTEYKKTSESGEEYVASSEEAFADAKATLEQNVEAMREWAENLDALAERGIDDGLLEQLRSMGPEGLPLVEGFVNASDEELSEMESLFGESAELSKDALMSGLTIEEGTIIDGAEELIFNTGETLSSAVQSSGLAEIIPDGMREGKEDMVQAGKDVAEGAAQGIEQGSGNVKIASKEMADGTNEAFAGALGIRSPSTVFMQHGRDIIAGLLQGFNQQKPQVFSLIRQYGQQLNKVMSDSITEMTRSSDSSFKGMASNIQRETTEIVNQTRTSMTQMTTQTRQGIRQIEQTYEQGYSRISSNSQREMRQMVQDLQRNTRTQQTTVQSAMRNQTNMIQSGMRTQVNVARNAQSQVVTHSRSGMNQVVNVTRNAMNQAVSAMRSTAGQARNAGLNMGLGFRNGLASTSGGIMATARNIANSAASTIRSALRIHSPSRVTEALGKFTGEGLVVGMRGKVRDVERIANEMARKAIPQIDVGRSLGTVGGASASTNTVYNNQSYVLNAQTPSGGSWTQEDYQRLLRELVWYINQDGGVLDG